MAQSKGRGGRSLLSPQLSKWLLRRRQCSRERSTDRPRTRLLRNGEKLQVSELRDRPLIFGERTAASDPAVANLDEGSGSLPLPPRKGSIAFLIHYTVPIYALTMRSLTGSIRSPWCAPPSGSIATERGRAQSRADYVDSRRIYFVAALISPSRRTSRFTCRRTISFSIWAYGTQLAVASATSRFLWKFPSR